MHRKWMVSLSLLTMVLLSMGVFAYAAEPGTQHNMSEFGAFAEFGEAPDLAALVADGLLEPVSERLPSNPAVVVPVDSLGQYGGTWRRYGHLDWAVYGHLLYEPLVRWGPDAVTVEPNLAEAWEVNEDGTRFVFTLREGLRWSDGAPVTTEDVMFWYEDILLNRDLTPSIPAWIRVAGEAPHIAAIDDYTFEVEFAEPYAIFLETLATLRGQNEFLRPKHYLSQFHPNYADPQELETMVDEAGFDAWYQLFGQKADHYANVDLPAMWAWRLTQEWGATGLRAERNPYYFKVDSEGNQLPYVDRIAVYYASDWDVAFLRIIGGESEMQAVGSQLTNYPLYMENRERGNYSVHLNPGVWPTEPAMMFNQTIEDEALREIFRDARFRQAMSLAIDREEINELFFFGLADPRQATIPEQSPFYDEAHAQAFADFDPERAKELLDEMGLEVGPDGFRLRPDGQRLEIVLETRQPNMWIDISEMIEKYWNDVGVATVMQVRENALWHERVNANQHQVVTQGFFTHPLMIGSSSFNLTGWPAWGVAWASWINTGGASGEEPVPEVLEIIDLWEEYRATVDTDVRNELGHRMMQIHADNVWIINAGGRGMPFVTIVHNDFRNVPEEWVYGGPTGTEGGWHPEQFWIDR